MSVSEVWGFIAAAFIIVMPLVNEGVDIFKAIRCRESSIADVATMETDSTHTLTSKSGHSMGTNGKQGKTFTGDGLETVAENGEAMEGRHQPVVQEVAPLKHTCEELVKSEPAMVAEDNNSVSSDNPRAPIFD